VTLVCVDVIVTLRGGEPAAVAATHAELYGAKIRYVYTSALRGYAASVPAAAVASLGVDSLVARVEPDHAIKTYGQQTTPTGVARTFATANDLLGLDGIDSRVDADIAVLDSGVDHEHPDLNVVGRTDCTARVPGAPDDAANCLDDAGSDRGGHGTHVAGAAAALDNSEGVVGIAPGARLWSVKVIADSGVGHDSQLIAGIDWVTAHSEAIEVANLSLGCAFCQSDAVDAAIANSVARGVVYVVAAGNEGMDAADISPGNHPDVITVAALSDFDGLPGAKAVPTCIDDADDSHAPFSNFGPTVELIAPGTCIRSTLPGGRYGDESGTSMATPLVSGAVALLASLRRPSDRAGVLAVREALADAGNLDWVDDSGDEAQEPLLDVGGAQFAPRLLTGPFNASPVAVFTRNCDARLRCEFNASSSYDRDGKIRDYAWEISGGERRDGRPRVDSESGHAIRHKFPESGTYTVRLTVSDDRGAVGRQAVLVTVMKDSESLAEAACGGAGDEKCEEWVGSYDNPNGYRADGGLDVAEAVAAADDGSVFVTGASEDNATASADVATVSFSRNGRQRWVARHAGTGGRIDGGAEIALSPDERRVFVAGAQDVELGGERALGDIAVLAYRAENGRQLWSSHFGQPDLFESVADIAVSPDGRRLYVAGSRDLPGCQAELGPDFFWPCSAFLVVAYDADSGRELWTRSYGVGDRPSANGWAMRLAPDGRRLYVTGTAFDVAAAVTVNPTVAYSSSDGTQLWSAVGSIAGFGALMAVDPSGSAVYVTSGAETVMTTAYAAASGERLWAAEESGGRQTPQALAADADGVYLTATQATFRRPVLDIDTVTAAYARADGRLLWQQRYEGRDSADAASTQAAVAVQTAGGRVYVSGTEAAGGGRLEAFTVSYGAGAHRQWAARYSPSSDPETPGGAAATASTLTPDRRRLVVAGFFARPADPANASAYALLAYDIHR
jgi:subtilisin family serine protease